MNYLDKLLDEIQLRFRDKYAQDLKEFNFQSNFNDFSGEFETIRNLAEKKCQDSKQMGTFQELKNCADEELIKFEIYVKDRLRG